jgi:multicomponent Na+:H+ antiporter subunit C
LGFVLLTHAVNLLIIAAGGVSRRDAPFFGGDTSQAADPLPQAFVLTAIVIAFAITVVLATFAVVGRRDDDTEADNGAPSQSELDGRLDALRDSEPDSEPDSELESEGERR